MAGKKASEATDRHLLVPPGLWPRTTKAPRLRDVLSQIGEFLQDVGLHEAAKALVAEAERQKIDANIEKWLKVGGPERTLMSMWAAATSSAHTWPQLPDSEEEAGSESDDSSSDEDEAAGGAAVGQEKRQVDEESSDADSDSSSSSGEESEAPAQAGQKRKRQVTPGSSKDSSSDSDSENDAMKDVVAAPAEAKSERESSSDESDERPLKRTKVNKEEATGKSASSSSDSDSDSSSSDSDSEKASGPATKSSTSLSTSKSGSARESSASSSSDSSSESSSDSSSDSDSSASPPPSPRKKKANAKAKKAKPQVFSSIYPHGVDRQRSPASSSATLEATSPVKSPTKESKEKDTLVVHDEEEGTKHIPATKENIKQLKKEQVSFSRIPADTKVDPKFGSNKYVPYDYADRAYRDLSVTKGKGFTKEKNKKKRGEHSPHKSAEQRDWEAQAREDLSPESSSSEHDELLDDDANLFGFKGDTWAFKGGCGFNPMSRRWSL